MKAFFAGKTAVLTGAGSGFGLVCTRPGAQLGMHLVLATDLLKSQRGFLQVFKEVRYPEV